jgi:hypothetical protein
METAKEPKEAKNQDNERDSRLSNEYKISTRIATLQNEAADILLGEIKPNKYI